MRRSVSRSAQAPHAHSSLGAGVICADRAGDLRRVVVARRAGCSLPPSPLAAGRNSIACPTRRFATRRIRWSKAPGSSRGRSTRISRCCRNTPIASAPIRSTKGVDQVLESARRYGLKVLHGIWLSSEPEKNRATGRDRRSPRPKHIPTSSGHDRRQRSAAARAKCRSTDLIAIIREVKAQVPKPVTYADVWEFWLRYPDVQNAVDFVTIHILPYWEDFPIPAARAAAHVAAIRNKVAAAIPGKEIVIGEFGWPSAGRMREGARPSPSNQARAITETLALAQAREFPGQHHRGVRSALEARARRRGRRLLGHHRSRDRRAEIQLLRRRRLRSSALAGAGACRASLLAALTFGGAFVGGRGKESAPLRLAEDRRAGVSSRGAVRLDARDGSGRELQPRAAGCAHSPSPRSRPRLRSSARRPARPAARCLRSPRSWPRRGRRDALALGAWRHVDRADACLRSKPRSDWCSIRATATFRSRRSPRPSLPFLVVLLVDAASGRTASRAGERRRRRAGGVGRLRRVQRELRQLAVGLVLRRLDRRLPSS